MARKGYDEGCLAAHALDLIGDRWALLVLRELMLGPKRFGLIRTGLPGIATNILTTRLESLEAAGLLTREMTPPPAAVPLYHLTDAGLESRGVIDALCRWGVRQPGHDPRKFISPTSLMLSMAIMARPAGTPMTIAFDMGTEHFLGHLGTEGFAPVIRPDDSAPETAATLVGDGNSLAIAVYGPAPLADLQRAGTVQIKGDADAAQDFVKHFSLGR